MAGFIYAGDRIRRKKFLHNSDSFGSIGCFGVAALRDAYLVAHAV